MIRRLLFFLRRHRAAREIEEELRFHLEERQRALVDEGLGPEEARHTALRQFGGGTLRVREQSMDAWIWQPLDAFLQDLRHAARGLCRQPRFVAAVLATLAIGIGANTAVFSLVDALLLRPLPFPAADRLVVIQASRPQHGLAQVPLSYLNFADIRQQARTFDGMAAWAVTLATIEGRGGPEQAQCALVTHGLFELLGATPTIGRTIAADEERRGTTPVAIVSDSLWQRQFGGGAPDLGRDRAIADARLTIQGRPHAIVGVLPAGFRFASFPRETEVWIPVGAAPNEGLFFSRGLNMFGAIGRVKAGVPLARAHAELDTIARALADAYPDVNRGRQLRLVALREQTGAQVRTALLILMAAVALVLLMTCANVANLLLVRAASRERELAVRAALGCTRARLVTQLLVEHMLLALSGGAIGLGLASVAHDLLAQLPYITPDLYTPYLITPDRIALDHRVLLFTLGLSLFTGLIVGLLPALRRSPASLTHALASAGARTTGDRHTHRVRSALIVAEVALSALLLTGMTLTLQSFQRVRQIDPGIDPHGIVAIEIRLTPPRYAEPSRIRDFYRASLDRLRALPGVTGAAATEFVPFSGISASTSYLHEGRTIPPQAERLQAHYRSISDGYFEAMAIALKKGRTFTVRDDGHAPRVAIINEAMARQAFPTIDPIGQRITLDFEAMRFRRDGPPDLDVAAGLREIVGVVANVHHGGLMSEAVPEMYVPAAQRPVRDMTLVLRTNVREGEHDDGEAVMGGVIGASRAIVRDIDPAQPTGGIVRLEDLVAASIARPRFNTVLLSIFGLLALALAAVGVYGVMSQAVALRTRDLGIRVALGATRGAIWRMVVWQALSLTALGTIAGLAAAFAASRIVASLLFDVDPRDPWTFAAVAGVLGVMSLVAVALPARRALRIDPVTALRLE